MSTCTVCKWEYPDIQMVGDKCVWCAEEEEEVGETQTRFISYSAKEQEEEE